VLGFNTREETTVDEIVEIDKEVGALRKRIFELNKRRIQIKKQQKLDLKPVSPETLAIPIAALPFSRRIRNALKGGGIETLGGIVQYSEQEFVYGYRRGKERGSFPNLGEKSVLEIKELLLTFGLKLKGDE
jgi:DNA-directed RNA polymerase alpha subunit